MTGPLHYCSYFDHRYLARALCLYDSLRTHSTPFVWHVLALSDPCQQILRQLDLPFVRVTTLEELERTDPALLIAKGNRSLVEYYFTLTSAYCKHVLGDVEPSGLLTYLDSDLYFYHSPQCIVEELRNASVGIIEHRFSAPNRDKIKYGRFNVGWVSFRNDTDGNACLDDWYQRSLDWCYDRLEPERFADQKYLDQWPSQFRKVHIIQHPGANVGPWNVEDFALEPSGIAGSGPIDKRGHLLLFAHFQYVRRLSHNAFETGLDAYQVDVAKRREIVRQIYMPYLRHLKKRQASIVETLKKAPAFDDAALRYAPKMIDGRGVRVWMHFPFKYVAMMRSRNWVTVW